MNYGDEESKEQLSSLQILTCATLFTTLFACYEMNHIRSFLTSERSATLAIRCGFQQKSDCNKPSMPDADAAFPPKPYSSFQAGRKMLGKLQDAVMQWEAHKLLSGRQRLLMSLKGAGKGQSMKQVQ